MKSFEDPVVGLPAFEAEDPESNASKRAASSTKADWVSERFEDTLRRSSADLVWRGYREYDSPLAG